MNEDVYQKNMRILRQSFPGIADIVADTVPSERVSFVESRNGSPVPRLASGRGPRPLHSLVDPEREGRRVFEATMGDLRPGFVVALGIGGGYHLRSLVDSPWPVVVLVVEHDLHVLKSTLQRVDLSWLFSDARVRLVAGEPFTRAAGIVEATYHPLVHGGYGLLPLRSRMRHDEAFFSECVGALEEAIGRISYDMSTQARLGRIWFRNTMLNLLRTPLSEYRIPDAQRVVVAAAGPSLELHLSELKEDRGSKTIISVDTAASTLIETGIIPDIVVSIDSQLVSYHHVLKPLPRSTLLVLDLSASPIVAGRAERRLYVSGGHPLGRYFRRSLPGIREIDTSGANVTCTAVDLALAVGATEIEIFGADFSYPEGKPYAKGTFLYPHFSSRCSRIDPVETEMTGLVFTSERLERKPMGKSIRYIPESMTYYAGSLASLIESADIPVVSRDSAWIYEEGAEEPVRTRRIQRLCRMHHAYRNASPGEDETPPDAGQIASLIGSYVHSLREIPPPTDPLHAYVSGLDSETQALLHTVLPTALHMSRRSTCTPAEAVSKALVWAVYQAGSAVSGFS